MSAANPRWKSELAYVRGDELPIEDIEIHRDFWVSLPHGSLVVIPGVLPDPFSGPPTGYRSWRVQICEHDLAEGVERSLEEARTASLAVARKFADDMATALGGKVIWGGGPQ